MRSLREQLLSKNTVKKVLKQELVKKQPPPLWPGEIQDFRNGFSLVIFPKRFSTPCFSSTLQGIWAGWIASLILLAYLCGRKRWFASAWNVRKVFIFLRENISNFFNHLQENSSNDSMLRKMYLWAFCLNSFTKSTECLRTGLCYCCLLSPSGDANCGRCAVPITTKDSLLCM